MLFYREETTVRCATIRETFALAFARSGARTQSQFAEILGFSPGFTTNVREGRSPMTIELAIALGELVDQPPQRLYAMSRAERAQNARTRRFWRQLMASLGILFVSWIHIPTAETKGIANTVYYVKRWLRSKVHWLRPLRFA